MTIKPRSWLTLLQGVLIVLVPLAVIYQLASWKNAPLDLSDPTFFQWLAGLLRGELSADASSDDLSRDLWIASLNSLKIVAFIYSGTLLLCCSLGIVLHAQKLAPRHMLRLITVLSTLTLLPSFAVYYLALKWGLMDFTMLGRGGHVALSFWGWWAPVVIFAVFNSYFIANAVAVKDALDEIFSQLFIRFYRAKGAAFGETLWMIKINWLLPILRVFLYFLPFVVAESIIFEFVFRISGLGSLLWYASTYDFSLEAVRVFTPKLMALTLIFSLIVHLTNGLSALLARMMSR